MASEKVDITGLDKLVVLKALWSNSKVATFYANYPEMAPSFSEEQASRSLANGYVDYCCGRVIKADFRNCKLDSYGYDRDNGEGKMKQVIRSLL